MIFIVNEIDCPSEFLSFVKIFVPYDVLDGKCDVYMQRPTVIACPCFNLR
jgi:hypothetical protein